MDTRPICFSLLSPIVILCRLFTIHYFPLDSFLGIIVI
jgi:hypothetical protein